MKRHKCDVLNFEWETNSRDTNIVEPVLCYLELFCGLHVIRSSYENFLWKLLWYKPKMLLISNCVGSSVNTMAARQAKALGIKVVSLISEGDIKDVTTAPEFLWGWNKKKEVITDLLLLWSKRSEELILRTVPESKQLNIDVSGATGFDRYKLLSFMTKEEFLMKYQRQEKKVVGIASWGFDYFEKEITSSLPYTQEERKYLRDTRVRIRDALKSLICAHPDTLFVLKLHPGSRDNIESTEFEGLTKLKNVLLLILDEPISNVINASDFWIGFETTTALEAWLLGKQTIFLNPTGGVFLRSAIVDGSPEIISEEELEAAYRAFYECGSIPGFQEREQYRKDLIQSIIQYDDGKNHYRAAQQILKIWRMPHTKRHDTLDHKRERARELLWEVFFQIQCHLPVKKRTGAEMMSQALAKYSPKERENEAQKYRVAVKAFHQEGN